jgi:hypothetical protein
MRVVSLIASAVALSLSLVSAPARAEDTTPPVISYTPPAGSTAPKGAFTVTAKVTDESKCYPQVFFRYGAGGAYEKAIDMRKSTKGKDLYEAIIPYKSEKIEFYVEAYDDFGNGPGRAGDPDSPFRINMGDKAAPAPSASAAPSKPSPSKPSGSAAPAPRPAPAAAVASSGGGGGGGRVWTWVSGGLGVGLLTGGVLAGLAVKAQDDAYKQALAGSTGPTGSTTTASTAALNAQHDANKALGTKATILTIAGGVLLAGSVGLFFLESPGEPEPVKKPGVGGDAVWGQTQPVQSERGGIVIGAVPVEGGGAAVIAGRF